jgi:demethoxyubiquinone hydroxylase (CLK1/Coq7/Cat5 family)
MDKKDFDISIIRPEMRSEDFKWRREGRSAEELRGIKRGLRTLQTLETMAVNIYRFQITRKPNELNLYLLAAMGNEMTHLQDFQVKLFEYGYKPSKFRVLYWIVGAAMGFISRALGPKAILKTGVWVEKKAVRHYGELLRSLKWDSQTRRIIEKDQADEEGHINRWRELLKKSG